MEKKTACNDQVRHIEQGSFSSLAFSMSGGMGIMAILFCTKCLSWWLLISMKSHIVLSLHGSHDAELLTSNFCHHIFVQILVFAVQPYYQHQTRGRKNVLNEYSTMISDRSIDMESTVIQEISRDHLSGNKIGLYGQLTIKWSALQFRKSPVPCITVKLHGHTCMVALMGTGPTKDSCLTYEAWISCTCPLHYRIFSFSSCEMTVWSCRAPPLPSGVGRDVVKYGLHCTSFDLCMSRSDRTETINMYICVNMHYHLFTCIHVSVPVVCVGHLWCECVSSAEVTTHFSYVMFCQYVVVGAIYKPWQFLLES